MTRSASATALRLRAVAEERAGPKWQRLARASWPAYRDWYVSEGESQRPSYLRCCQALEQHMPELMPLWERLTELLDGSDLAARFLSGYLPPSYITGCSQAVWARDEVALVRNYDYHPDLFEGVLLFTRWHGTRVLAMSEGLWGVLDGLNEHGLAVSLSFGGRRPVGDGFGIPLVLRYVLEFCTEARQAAEVLARVPTHMAYNITLTDRSGIALTVLVAPDRASEITTSPVATNHQGDVTWAEHATATRSVEREALLSRCLAEGSLSLADFEERFGAKPLYSAEFARGFGTLYTAIYRPQRLQAEFRWPGLRWSQSFDAFREGSLSLRHPRG